MSKTISRSVQTLHAEFVACGRNAREWMRKCALLLPAIERERVWEKKGFGSIHEYAAKLAGMSHESVNDALRVLRATEDMPAIRAVIEARGVNAVKPVVTALTVENEAFWAEKVTSMSQHALQVFRHELEENDKNADRSFDIFGRGAPSENEDFSQQKAIDMSPATQRIPKNVLVIHLDPAIAARLEKLCVANGGDWNVVMQELLAARAKILEQERPESVDASSRHIPVEIERFVTKRSGGLCEFPKCTRTYAILHHTQRFALEAVHNPARIVALCTAHERLAHLGLIAYEEERTEKWTVREEADPNETKYAIDQQVQRFRRPG